MYTKVQSLLSNSTTLTEPCFVDGYQLVQIVKEQYGYPAIHYY